MSDNTWPNLVAMFFDQAKRHGDDPFLWAKRDGAFHPLTWRQTAEQVVALARGLKHLGLDVGDRVALVSENRPEWLISDIAIMAAGGVTVPAYTTNTEGDHLHVAVNSGAKGAIVSTRKLAANVLPAAHRADDMDFVITMDAPGISQHLSVNVHAWDDVLAGGAAGTFDVAAEAGRWRSDDTACIIYTSGTGGAPKGVMLHHSAILHNCKGAEDALIELGLGDEVFLSFLPLSHSYEHTAGQFFPLLIGAQIFYAEGIDSLGADMAEAKPTIMTAVPRLYEMLHARITRGLIFQSALSQKLFGKALELGIRRYHDPAALGPGERVMDTVLDALVRGKVRRRFGGRLKALVSGGAPLNPDIGIFFTALGLRILQGYGQTESAPVVSVNRPAKVKMHTVGPPMQGVAVRIADDGEILVQGDLVMQGYWRNEDATREVIRDGWLHTGDVGLIDEDGYIIITDRKKDIIVNSGGDNLSPQRVEGKLTLEPEIAQAMVYGDRRPHLVALLVPDAEWLENWAASHGRPADLAVLAGDDDFGKDLGAAVSRVNADLSSVERVRRFLVAPDPFTIANSQMTPTMKVRRHILREVYGEALESLYG